jgi:hypothetical protein
LLLHIATDAKRKHKFYDRLPDLIRYLKKDGYQLSRIDN